MISNLRASPLANKRFRILYTAPDGTSSHYDFGMPGAKTFVDGASEDTRRNYLARHLANPIEKRLIRNKIPSPSLFAAYILWGDTRDIGKNIRRLNSLL